MPIELFQFVVIHDRLLEGLAKSMNDMAKGEKEFIWDIPKIHMVSHYSADIIRSGSTHHYNAELFEHLHKKVNFNVVY